MCLPRVAARRGDLEMVQTLVEAALIPTRTLYPVTKQHLAYSNIIRPAVTAATRAGYDRIAQWLRSRTPIEFSQSEMDNEAHTSPTTLRGGARPVLTARATVLLYATRSSGWL